MEIFNKKYSFVKSLNEELGSMLFPAIIIIIVWLIIFQAINFWVLGFAFLVAIPYYRGLGKVSIQENEEELHFLAEGRFPIDGKIIKTYSGWSYRFTPRMPNVLDYAFPYMMTGWFGRNRSSTSSTSPSNTIVLNMIFELDNGKHVIIHQQLPPWREIPKGWDYVGNHIKQYQYFFKVKSGVKQLRNRLEN